MNDMSMSDVSKRPTRPSNMPSSPHLSSVEWEALHRLAAASDEAVIQSLFTAGTEAQEHLTAQGVMALEIVDLPQRVSTLMLTKNRPNTVKLNVSSYSGEDDGRLHLNRWLCVEVEEGFDVSHAPAPKPEPKPMGIDAIQQYDGRRGATSSTRRPHSSTRGPRQMNCFRCGKPELRSAPVGANVMVERTMSSLLPKPKTVTTSRCGAPYWAWKE
ncbi:hypothetical protein PC121_g5018 [Phytophthora cactorum]|nr:hypothetical protein PC120_g4365 [Phytophthora cactorum]KAG3086169.1 hypothetical protein PC121_g5018 [Phytophthora cactorum]